MSEKQRWIDFAAFGFYLGEHRMADGRHRLVFLDMENRGDSAKLKDIGFLPMIGSPRYQSGIYYLDGDEQRLRPKALADTLGIEKCLLVDIDIAEIDRVFRKKILEKFETNLNALTLRSRPLGQNASGLPVFESSAGRFIRKSNDEVVSEGTTLATELGRAAFLRATNDEELRQCAEGFIWAIHNGNKTTWPDVIKFGKTVFGYGIAGSGPNDDELFRLQEAIESASYRRFAEANITPDENAFRRALDFYYGLPIARMRTTESIFLQQYSTPLPMSVVAQRLLIADDDCEGKTVIEPTAGNGGLINLLPRNLTIFAAELDEKRVASLSELAHVNAQRGDATSVSFRQLFNVDVGFDYTIANPPFGQMVVPQAFDKISNVRKQDHLIALRTLESRKDDGRSVLIFGADSAQSDGAVKGSTKSFLNYVHDHYYVHGLTEVDGRLYSRQGSGFNVRMMVIGDKRHTPHHITVPEKLSILTSYEDLWQWSSQVIERCRQSSVLDSIKIDVGIFAPTKPVFETEHANNFIEKSGSTAELGVPQTVERHVNEFQAPYQPASRIGEPTAMVPINMAGATYAALNDLEASFGRIDQFVASKLHYDEEQLPQYFSPEQIDAIGLAIKSVEEGRGIINADQTGMGKGRFVAAMLRYAKLNEKMPVFLTIKSELFTDIFRDISDIGSLHLFQKLFIFNDGENIKQFGTENAVLFRATSTQERKAAISAGAVEPDVDMVLATYSQFMRAYEKNPKASLLTQIVSNNGMLILDEAHVASGVSNLSASVGQAVSNSDAVLYSSATPLKNVSNFSIYSKIFPKSVDLAALPDTLKAGGEALQEAISNNMARDGVLIRREHDFSQLTFFTRLPGADGLARNVTLANALSEIVAGLSYLSGDVSREVAELNKGYKSEWADIPEADRRGSRMQASSMSFGSRLFSLNRQFLLGIKIDDAVETALVALKEGRKPVIAVENTGESLLRQVIARRANIEELEAELLELDERIGVLNAEETLRRSHLTSKIYDAMRNVVLDEPPQFRELLESMLDRIGVIKIQGRYGDVIRKSPDSVEYEGAQHNIREKILAFPDLPLTPIDVIKKALHERGHPVTEVSGRTVSIAPNEANKRDWDVNFHSKADAVANVAGFQNGKYDAIVITRSGSTGISLHATDRFDDSDIRQRDFIVLQKAANIAEFLQWMGRVNRKDQVVPPVITGLESGLPGELRLTMMHNLKLRKLSANTTSNRDNANIEGKEIDLLNDVGDRVALEWLTENPDIAAYLDIGLPNEDDDTSSFSQDCPYINKLMGRLMMVSVAKQEDILKSLTERFGDRIEELDQRGENPFKVDVFDWKARIVNEEELESGVIRSVNSTFDEPVKIVTVQHEQNIIPIRSDKLLGMLKQGVDLFCSHESVNECGSLTDFCLLLNDLRDEWIRNQLPAKLRHSEAPLSELLQEGNTVGANNAKTRADFLVANILSFRPGTTLDYEDPYKGERRGIIVSVELPTLKEDFFLLSKYRAKVVFSGEEKVKDMTLATVRNQGKNLHTDCLFVHDFFAQGSAELLSPASKQFLAEFDGVPDGKIIRTHHLLQGNIFRACEMAFSQKLGAAILFTDMEGNRQRAILLKDRITPDKVKAIPIGLDAGDMADYIAEYVNAAHPKYEHRLRQGLNVCDSPVKDMKPGEGVMFQMINEGAAFRLSVPGTKSRSRTLLVDGTIFDMGEQSKAGSLRLRLSGTKSGMFATVRTPLLQPLMELMQRNQHVGKFYISEPDQDVINTLRSRFEVAKDIRSSETYELSSMP